MVRVTLAALAAVLLAACAQEAPPTPAQAAQAAAVVETPFYLAFKAASCVGTAAAGGPLGALAALAPGDDAAYFEGEIERGLALNCGPPYVLIH